MSHKTLSKTITLIVPFFNEADNLLAFYQSLQTVLDQLSDYQFEFIFIDDGSSDQSAAIVTQLPTGNYPVKLLQLSRNFGKENAITAGLDHCHSDAAIIIDADGQHPPMLIPQFIHAWENGVSMAYGIQTSRKNEPLLKRVFTQIFYNYLNRFTNIHIPKNAGDFRLLDRSIVTALNQCQEKSRFMKGLYAWVGFKSLGIPFVAEKRRSGESKWKLRRLSSLALAGITSFTHLPLRIWTVFGMLISIIAFCYGSAVVINTIISDHKIPGYATIVTAVFFFGGIQLLSIGILGEYIGRIFIEVKQRPGYIIANKYGFDND